MPNGNQTTPDLHDIAAAGARLRRLDRQEWWRWGSVAAVTLLLSLGVLFLCLPLLSGGPGERGDLESAVTGLFVIVLIFDGFAFYQQAIITRLRRELMKQLGMVATLEMLRPAGPEAEAGRAQRRRFQRYHLDRRMSVTVVLDGKERVMYGRTSDLSEYGVGAVIPESLESSTPVTIEIILGNNDEKLVAKGVVRHRRGFHHGFEFLGLAPSQTQEIHRACAGAIPVFEVVRPQSSN